MAPVIEILKITHDGHQNNIQLSCTCGQPSLASFECEDDLIIYCSNCGDITSRARLRNNVTLIRPDVPWVLCGVTAQAECPLVNVSLPVEVHPAPSGDPSSSAALPAVVTKISTEQCFLRFDQSGDTNPNGFSHGKNPIEILLTSDLPPLQGQTHARVEERLQPFGNDSTIYYRLRFLAPTVSRKAQLEAFFQVSCGLDFDWRLLICADLEPLRHLRRLFRSLLPNARIEAVTSEADFRASLDEHKPDLAIFPPQEPFQDFAQSQRSSLDQPSTRLIALVGSRSSAAVAEALRLGAHDILFADCSVDEVRRLIQRYKTEEDIRQATHFRRSDGPAPSLWTNVDKPLQSPSVSVNDEETVRLLCLSSETHDVNSSNHLKRIAAYTAAITKMLGWDSARIARLATASKLHDIGKMGVADNILRKPGALTAEERTHMEKHTRFGYHILHSSASEVIRLGAVIALRHHECYDGSGYPDGLKGNAIPLESQVVSVADVFDALTTQRVYKAAWSNPNAADYLLNQAGRAFNPLVVEAFHKTLPAIESIQQQFQDDFRDIWTERRDSTRRPARPFGVHLEIAMPEQTFRPYRLQAKTTNISHGGMKLLVEGVSHDLFALLSATRRFGKVLFGQTDQGVSEQSLCEVVWMDYYAIPDPHVCAMGLHFQKMNAALIRKLINQACPGPSDQGPTTQPGVADSNASIYARSEK